MCKGLAHSGNGQQSGVAGAGSACVYTEEREQRGRVSPWSASAGRVHVWWLKYVAILHTPMGHKITLSIDFGIANSL